MKILNQVSAPTLPPADRISIASQIKGLQINETKNPRTLSTLGGGYSRSGAPVSHPIAPRHSVLRDMRLDGPSTTRETGGVGLKFDLGTGDPVRRLSDHAPSQNRVSFLPSVKPEDSPILDHPPIQASECAGAHHPKTDHRESLSRPRDSGSISSSMPSSVIKGRSRLSSASSQTVKVFLSFTPFRNRFSTFPTFFFLTGVGRVH